MGGEGGCGCRDRLMIILIFLIFVTLYTVVTCEYVPNIQINIIISTYGQDWDVSQNRMANRAGGGHS